jgi:hypothetical protein
MSLPWSIGASAESVGCLFPSGRYPLVSRTDDSHFHGSRREDIRVAPPALAGGPQRRRDRSSRNSPSRTRSDRRDLCSTEAYPLDKIIGPKYLHHGCRELVSFGCAIDFWQVPESGRAKQFGPRHSSQPTSRPGRATPTRWVFHYNLRALARGSGRSEPSLRNRPNNRCDGSNCWPHPRASARVGQSSCLAHHRSSQTACPSSGMLVRCSNGDFTAGGRGTARRVNHVCHRRSERFAEARAFGFVKIITIRELSPPGWRRIAGTVGCLAETEGLRAHAAVRGVQP